MISRKNVTYITNYLCCTETSVPADNILSYPETRQQDSAAIDNSMPPVEGITETSDILMDSEAGVLEDEDIISDLLDNSLINNVLDLSLIHI